MEPNYKNISIPNSLFLKVQSYIKDREYSSVDEFVTFIIEEHLSIFESLDNRRNDDEKLAEDRLKRLGYI